MKPLLDLPFELEQLDKENNKNTFLDSLKTITMTDLAPIWLDLSK